MKAIIKEVGKEPKVIDIENTLKALQKAVGGYIETLNVGNNVIMLCDEEGKLKEKPYNFAFSNKLSDVIVGDVLFTKLHGDDFTALDENDIETILHFFSRTPYTT